MPPAPSSDPAERRFLSTESLTMRWGDMDALGHLNNAVYLNFGIDFYWVERDYDPGRRYWHYGAGFGLPVALHWEFYFTENWSAFAELGVNVFFHPSVFHNGRGWDVHPGAWVLFQVGGRFHINEWFALTLRVGNPYVSFGITFLLG